MKLPEIVVLPIHALVERAKNPNAMEPAQYALLVKAIKKVGFVQPLLVRYPDGEPISGRDGRGAAPYEIIDGVHRKRAAEEAGLTELPCVVVDSDEAEAAALQIGMNRMRGELDLGGVARELGELEKLGWSREEMELTGFDGAEIASLLKAIAPVGEIPEVGSLAGPEDAPEEDPETAIGRHLLEIPFATKKALVAAKRKLRKLGGGDLAVGLLQLLDDEG